MKSTALTTPRAARARTGRGRPLTPAGHIDTVALDVLEVRGKAIGIADALRELASAITTLSGDVEQLRAALPEAA